MIDRSRISDWTDCNSFSVHRAKDSYLSWGSGFQHFEGVMNWAFLMLAIGGIRLFLENFNK